MADLPESASPSEGQESPTQEIVTRLTPLLKPEKRQEAERLVGMVLRKTHSGPLPAPEDLGHYEEICPGAADRIISMAEGNMQHRQAMEKSLVSKEYGMRSRGQWLALVALFAMLALIGFTFWLGQPIAGAILGGGTLVAVTGMFLGRDKETEEKAPPQPQPKIKRQPKRR